MIAPNSGPLFRPGTWPGIAERWETRRGEILEPVHWSVFSLH